MLVFRSSATIDQNDFGIERVGANKIHREELPKIYISIFSHINISNTNIFSCYQDSLNLNSVNSPYTYLKIIEHVQFFYSF